MKPLIGAPARAADFDHPIEMLAACHERIEDRIDVLRRLLPHLASHGCDGEARQAAANVIRYFDTAGEHHHEDEETDLFPVLIERAANGKETAVLIDRLRSDHVRMRALWQSLRAPLSAMAAGSSAELDRAIVSEFTRVYEEHIALEERELFPLAARVLDENVLKTLGVEMARRRGVTAR